jgi:hypothetical protein
MPLSPLMAPGYAPRFAETIAGAFAGLACKMMKVLALAARSWRASLSSRVNSVLTRASLDAVGLAQQLFALDDGFADHPGNASRVRFRALALTIMSRSGLWSIFSNLRFDARSVQSSRSRMVLTVCMPRLVSIMMPRMDMPLLASLRRAAAWTEQSAVLG